MEDAFLRINMQDAFLRIKAILKAIESDEGLNDLDVVSRDLLNYVLQKHSESQVLRVTDLTANLSFGSPATIYGRLAKLQDGGRIKTTTPVDDGRVKIVVPTSKALGSLGRMSIALQRALA